MKVFEKFNVNNPVHVSLLSYALEVAQNQTLQNGEQYLTERFEIPPLKALTAIFKQNGGFRLSELEEKYVAAYTKAIHHHIKSFNDKLKSIEDHEEQKDWGNYPDDFNPELWGLD